MTKQILDAYINLRVDKKTRYNFNRKAVKYGRPSDVLREIVQAFIDDRLEIKPPADKKENLYVN